MVVVVVSVVSVLIFFLVFFGFVGGVCVVAGRLGIIRMFGSSAELWGFGGMRMRKGVEVVVL